jgi:hypothetical protein
MKERRRVISFVVKRIVKKRWKVRQRNFYSAKLRGMEKYTSHKETECFMSVGKCTEASPLVRENTSFVCNLYETLLVIS